MTSGPFDAITDIDGIRVGHTTLHLGDDVRTGVTAIVPTPIPTPPQPLRANAFVGNGHGKATGLSQLLELGRLETPIVLTNTLDAFTAADSLLRWELSRTDCADVVSLNPVVAECNDSWLSDIRGGHVQREHVWAALDSATDGPVRQGCVGAGTGIRALGFKAGIGTASRMSSAGTVGVLVQANFTGRLRFGSYRIEPPRQETPDVTDAALQGNSCIIIVATDAAVDARQLGRLARRAVYAMARVGASYAHGSGDYAIALTTSSAAPIGNLALDPLFEATLDATEAALLNSLWHAQTTVGRAGHTAYGLREVLRDRGVDVNDVLRTIS